MRTASNNSSCGVASTSTRSAVSGVWMRQCELDQRRAGRDLARCPRYVVARVGALRKEGGSGGAGGGSRLGRAGGVGKLVPMTEPVSVLDVDRELWEVLDMCSDEELETLYSILYGSSPFSPVVKSLVREEEPAMLELRGRASIMHKVESRFRFLAADSSATIRGRRPSYRETLLSIRDRLDVTCSANLSTPDLETELFVHILQNCLDSVAAEGDPDPSMAAAAAYVSEGDGMASASDGDSERSSGRRANWSERLTAPLRFGFRDLLGPLVKLGGAATVSAVGRSTAERLASQLLCQHLRYQAVASAATRAAAAATKGAAAALQRQAALAAAQRGVTSATARYAALRGTLSWLGPLMWGWAALDLAMAALGTDYARLTRAVFVLAQVRLVATQGFTNAPPGERDTGASSAR